MCLLLSILDVIRLSLDSHKLLQTHNACTSALAIKNSRHKQSSKAFTPHHQLSSKGFWSTSISPLQDFSTNSEKHQDSGCQSLRCLVENSHSLIKAPPLICGVRQAPPCIHRVRGKARGCGPLDGTHTLNKRMHAPVAGPAGATGHPDFFPSIRAVSSSLWR